MAILTRHRVGRGLRWAAIVVGLMVLQGALGFATLAVPELAVLHAINALAIFSAAAYAATRLSPAPGATAPSRAAVAEPAS